MNQTTVPNQNENQGGQSGAGGMMGDGGVGETAGYPLLLQQYLMQQQQEQQISAFQQQNAAQLAMAGFPNGNGVVGQNFTANNAFGAHMMPTSNGWGLGVANGMGGLVSDNDLLLQQQQQQQQLQQQQQQQANLNGATAGSNGINSGDQYAANGILAPWSQHSAALLGKMGVTEEKAVAVPKVKRTRRKQPKDKPKRPLSAYNIFFKEERARLIEQMKKGKDEDVPADRTANGKIGFESLAKIIGGKWQELNPKEVEYYKEKAAGDMERYRKAMEEYNRKQSGKAKGGDEDKDKDTADAESEDKEESESESKRLKK